MEQCASHLVPHFEGYPAVVKENCRFMFWSLVETGKICSFLGAFMFCMLGSSCSLWLRLGFFSKHPSQCCVWKQVSSVIRSGVIILEHIFCVSGLSFGISDGMVSLRSIPLGEGF